jgi:hypothetical protein
MKLSTNQTDIAIFWKFWHNAPKNPDTQLQSSLRTPGQHRSIMIMQQKSRGHMVLPPPGMLRNSGPHFDQTLDEPFYGALYFLP